MNRSYRVQVTVTRGTPARTPERFVNMRGVDKEDAKQKAVTEMERQHKGVHFRAISAIEQDSE